ncbi:MAG: M48 family metalloprotease, partial [Luteimonas sp.]|nr:M48 family metalloprotease [Luteimonas sp.]
KVEVHQAPDFDSPDVAKLRRGDSVTVAGQQGLWFQVKLADGGTGYLRVTDVRMDYAAQEGGDANVRALFTGQSGKGRVTETAGVRGLDKSTLQSASFDARGLAAMEGNRVTTETAASHARTQGWDATRFAYAAEADTGKRGGASQSEKRSGFGLARSLLGSLTGGAIGGSGDAVLDVADSTIGKSEDEILAEELALGPELAGRVLGAAPLWPDAQAQRRVNLIGRWMASQTTRPELPWTFGVIDSPEVNAFAAPGGYVLVTRGMYELLANDAEVAAVLGHEISHVVQRDHYGVIHKQQVTRTGVKAATGQIRTGGVAEGYARDYARKFGATALLAGLDRDAEFRSDQAAEVYLVRSGFNPLALYAVLQKMTAFGTQSARLTQLYRTHPPLDARLDRMDRGGVPGLERYNKREAGIKTGGA